VTRSAVLFALRCRLDPTAPSNAGLEEPIEIVAPPGCLVNAQFPAAVVAGNVETSQRIADVVFKALAPVAGSRSIAQGQGTMNNCVLGNRHFTYYETLGGGQGASRQRPGLDGVHVGLSNTLNTPIEALELEYPLRVLRYELRQDSGGIGQQRGGWGLIRSLQVLQDCTLSLLTDRRYYAPQGEEGGGAGQVGINLVNGEPLPSKISRPLKAGDVVTLYTPGGGAWGSSEGQAREVG
jgi:N-methylhydantoinase B